MVSDHPLTPDRRYGSGSGSSWFSVPVTVGSKDFNLSISTSLGQSWIPGTSDILCAHTPNKDDCKLSPDGENSRFQTSGIPKALTAELEKKVYNKTIVPRLIPARQSDYQALLGLKGRGVATNESISLESKTGQINLWSQSISIFTDHPDSNGYLSLQQMALNLFAADRIPGPNFHLYLGQSAEANESSVPLFHPGKSAESYTMILGGYDSNIWDLKKTQRYPLQKTVIMSDVPGKGKLPATEEAGYRMELPIEDIIYRWTKGGDTGNSLLPAPSTVIIDTTTPYLWLPPKAVHAFVSATGATWNDTMDAYVFTRCFSDCYPIENTISQGVVDFKFKNKTITLKLSDYFRIQSLWMDDFSSLNQSVFPIRALKDESAPIVFGRAVMAGIHLWVDYAEEYFCLTTGNTTEGQITQPKIVPWSMSDHPSTTNTTILADTLGTNNPADIPGETEKWPIIAYVAAAVGSSVILLIIGIGIYCCFRRRRNTGPRRPLTMTVGPNELSGHDCTKPGRNVPSNDNKYYPLHEIDRTLHPGNRYSPPPLAVHESPSEHERAEVPASSTIHGASVPKKPIRR
ncbi:aspartic peptidase domain-containing protein [Pyronema omphalodes]|nr:aspartic peptidase domain-containing protein [Pyronema omphalodes]